MLKSVTVINQQANRTNVLKMVLDRPWETGFYIKSISGLGPPPANIAITDIATADGGYYNSARAQTRNIVLNLGFYSEPYTLIEDVRLLSYKYFPIKKLVTLIFETDNRIAYIQGYVESNEPNVFSKGEDTQISIICPYPYFRAYDDESGHVEFSSISAAFEFEWQNPYDPEEDADNFHTEFSQIMTYAQYNVPYYGDVDTGFVMTIHVYGSVADLTISDADTGESMKLDFTNVTVGATDDIIISTVRGEKYVKLYSGGTYTNILNCLDKNSDWLTLKYGDNQIAYTSTSGTEKFGIEVNFNTLYEGV